MNIYKVDLVGYKDKVRGLDSELPPPKIKEKYAEFKKKGQPEYMLPKPEVCKKLFF